MYFNEDCGVSYEIANKTVYYNDDGTIFDSYTHHMGYFNILNSTCTFYSTSTSVENQIIFQVSLSYFRLPDLSIPA